MINYPAIFHRVSTEYKIPLSKNLIELKLLTASDDLDKAYVIWWKRGFKENLNKQEMSLYSKSEFKDDYRIILKTSERTHYIQYCFLLIKGTEKVYFSQNGFYNLLPSDDFFEHLWTNDNEILTIPEWSKSIVYYQIFPDRFAKGENTTKYEFSPWASKPTRENFFGGNLAGIIDKIDYFVDLGIDAIYLCPIFFGEFNHRYATIDYFKIDPMIGNEEDFSVFIKMFHKNGIKIILDGVFNHVSTKFEKFKNYKKNSWFLPLEKKSEYSDVDYECVGDYAPMPKLNTSSSEVVVFIYSVIDYWLKKGIDGWRLDVSDEIDTNAWLYIRRKIETDHPNCLLLGEVWGDAVRNIGSGNQFHICMNYQFRSSMVDLFALHKIDCIQFINRIGAILSCYWDLINHCNYNLLSSHDVPRFLTMCKDDKLMFSLAICFQFLFIGSPSIYYGDEVGMTGEDDPDCRKCMTFSGDEKIKQLIKDLILLRKDYEELKYGKFSVVKEFCSKNTFCFERVLGEKKKTILFNLGEEEIEINKKNCIFCYPIKRKDDLEKMETKSVMIF